MIVYASAATRRRSNPRLCISRILICRIGHIYPLVTPQHPLPGVYTHLLVYLLTHLLFAYLLSKLLCGFTCARTRVFLFFFTNTYIYIHSQDIQDFLTNTPTYTSNTERCYLLLLLVLDCLLMIHDGDD